jgi:hypothetical protein
MVSTRRRSAIRAAMRLTATALLVWITVAAGLAAAGSVALVAVLSLGVLRWRSIEDRLFPPPARPPVAAHQTAEAEVLVEPVHPSAFGFGARQIVVCVVEVAVQVPQDGGV